MKKKSNIELLRIVLFLMVVSIHVTSVGLVLTKGGIQNGSLAWHYASLMRLLVAPAVIGFVLITGFLMVNKDINIKKYLKKIGAPFLIYFPILLLLECNLFKGDFMHKLPFVYADLIGAVGIFYHLWYIIVLAILALFMPYINKLLACCSKRQHLLLFFLLLFISTINTTATLLIKGKLFGGLVGIDARIFLFIALYIAGAYFGKYGIRIKINKSILGYILIPLSIFIYCVFNSHESIIKYVELSHLFIVMQGIFLFLLFMKLEFNNNIINYWGKYAYGAYIIHVFYISFLQRFIPFTTFFNNKYYFMIDLSFIVFVVIASLITEMLRVKLYKILAPAIASAINIIFQKSKKIGMVNKPTS